MREIIVINASARLQSLWKRRVTVGLREVSNMVGGRQGFDVIAGQGSRIPSLDGLRAISIALVLASHAVGTVNFPHLGGLMLYLSIGGRTGVRVFFVISGFLITTLLLAEEKRHGRVSLGAFYMRRSLRILPVYFCYLLVVFLLDRWHYLHIEPSDYLKALTYTTDLLGASSWALGHTWSLSVEEHFYLLWPTAFVLTPPRWRVRLILAALLGLPLLRLLIYTGGWRGLIERPILGEADVIIWGCGAALSVWFFPQLIEAFFAFRPHMFRGLSLLVIVLLARLEISPMRSVCLPFLASVQAAGITYLVCSYAMARGGTVKAVLNSRPFVAVGTLSYSIYIWQQPLLYPSNSHALYCQTFPQNLGVVLVVAVCSYYCVEKPFLRLKNLWRRAERCPTTSSGVGT